jgi:molybdopterin converting factor small subunit
MESGGHAQAMTGGRTTDHQEPGTRNQDLGSPVSTIRLEYYSWLAKELIGASESGATVELPLPTEGTVRGLLARLARESPKFAELVYDLQDERLREYATLIVNGRVVELVGGLDSPLHPGDHLLLLPGFSGG